MLILIECIIDSEWRLMLIRQRRHVGKTLNHANVYKIEKIALLPLSMKSLPSEFELTVSFLICFIGTILSTKTVLDCFDSNIIFSYVSIF